MRLLGPALIALCLLPAAAAAQGPALTEPAKARMAAIDCAGDLKRSSRIPVLLVHGTGATPDQNWRWGYKKVLLERGHSVCTVALPDRGRTDLQRGVEYVVTAIREVNRRAGRKISVIGHSQGAFQPAFALRVWPDLARRIDDFFGISGVYDEGSTGANADCADGACSVATWQFRNGSNINRALSRLPLPKGPSYTAVGTLADDTVTPQPKANGIAGMARYQIQDVCPGRRAAQDHLFMAADAVMFAFAMDALAHPGPARKQHIPATECAKQVFDGADLVDLGTQLPEIAKIIASAGAEVKAEPPLRCYLVAACVARSSATALIRSARLAKRRIRRGKVGRLAVRARAPGRIRLHISGRRAGRSRKLRAGRQALRFNTKRLRPGRYRLRLETRAQGASAWTVERSLRLRVLPGRLNRREARRWALA